MELIILISVVLMAVLNIMLFFKLWGMTNNVSKINNVVQANGYPNGVSPAKIEFALGNTEKAQGIARREFVVDVFNMYTCMFKQFDSQRGEKYTEEFNELERKYRELFSNASSFIDFGKLSTFEKAKSVFENK